MNLDQPQNPLVIIEGLRQQIYMMGANDSENAQINVIIEKYKTGEIEGPEAIQCVTELLNSKQDYH